MRNETLQTRIKQGKKRLMDFGASFRGRMMGSFLLVSVLPTLIIIFFSYFNSTNIVWDNANEMTRVNLMQTKKNLDVWVDSYEDILFQIYMNDDIVDLVKELNVSEDKALAKNRLRPRIRGMFYTKEYIKAITIISKSGEIVFYDMLTGFTTLSSWMGSVGYTSSQLYEMFEEDNLTHVIPTKEAGIYAGEKYHLFHLGHRIIDYQNVNKEIGVVILSIDEQLLSEIGNETTEEVISDHNYNFMTDNTGHIISHWDKRLIGVKAIEWDDNEQIRKGRYLEFLKKDKDIDERYLLAEIVYDDEFGCDIINVSNQDEVIRRLHNQQNIMLGVALFASLILLFTILALTKTMTHSINSVAEKMKLAGRGDLSVRAGNSKSTPTELKIIMNQFNKMLEKLQHSMNKEKEANEKQKNAEIAALEAQLNPHFLYNTLDTINWMAIDKDEYEISNAITALADILRYGIDNSNGIVKVKREYEWIKQYLFLQQTRLKGGFTCDVDIAPEVLEWNIHKLLMQPFIENAIIHGFKKNTDPHVLLIKMREQKDLLKIMIEDNGAGMEASLVDSMNKGIFIKNNDRNCIGMGNAINRLSIYYKDEASYHIDSESGAYTRITLWLPRINESGESICES